MESKHMPSGTTLTYEIALTNGAKPSFNSPMDLFLVKNIAFRVSKDSRTSIVWAVFHFKK